jgi:hypothetical protein
MAVRSEKALLGGVKRVPRRVPGWESVRLGIRCLQGQEERTMCAPEVQIGI